MRPSRRYNRGLGGVDSGHIRTYWQHREPVDAATRICTFPTAQPTAKPTTPYPSPAPSASPTFRVCHSWDFTNADGLSEENEGLLRAELFGGASLEPGAGVLLDGASGYISLPGLDLGSWNSNQYTFEVCLDVEDKDEDTFSRVFDFGSSSSDYMALFAGVANADATGVDTNQLRFVQAISGVSNNEIISAPHDVAGQSGCYAVTSDHDLYADGVLISSCPSCRLTLADTDFASAECWSRVENRCGSLRG